LEVILKYGCGGFRQKHFWKYFSEIVIGFISKVLPFAIEKLVKKLAKFLRFERTLEE